MYTLSLLSLFAVGLDAQAKRPAAPVAPKVPSIEEVVTAEGFTPTPSQSDIYKPGTVLVPNGRGGHDVVVESCVDAEPSVAIMSQSSIASTLSGGVSARLGVARGDASGSIEKRLSFVDPEQRTIPLAKLRPTEDCVSGVHTAGSLQDLSSAIVLHDVLVAIIKNSVCTKADASGGVVALGAAEAATYSECVMESDGQVPLGYKALPLSKVLAVAGGAVPTAAPSTPGAPAAASASVNFGATGGLGVEAKLKAQRCDQDSQAKGEAARRARLSAAASEVQAQATAAWDGQVQELTACAELRRSERTPCIDAVEAWLSLARVMVVSIPAGEESVETACGPRQPAFPTSSLTVAAAEVAMAAALLARLKATDVASTPATKSPVSSASPGAAGITWVDLGKFQISRTEVTVGQYRKCVDAGVCTAPDDKSVDNTCNWDHAERDDHPVNCVDWYQATAFAAWVGGRLPTKAEWTFAATSGGEPWKYAWGNKRASCDRAIMDDGGPGCGEGRTWPVCSKPAGNSTQGVCDLAGNVWEWTQEVEDADYRLGRGGGWIGDPSFLRVIYRYRGRPSSRPSQLGIRVLKSAP